MLLAIRKEQLEFLEHEEEIKFEKFNNNRMHQRQVTYLTSWCKWMEEQITQRSIIKEEILLKATKDQSVERGMAHKALKCAKTVIYEMAPKMLLDK